MPEEVVRNTSFSGGIAMKWTHVHHHLLFIYTIHLLSIYLSIYCPSTVHLLSILLSIDTVHHINIVIRSVHNLESHYSLPWKRGIEKIIANKNNKKLTSTQRITSIDDDDDDDDDDVYRDYSDDDDEN